MRRHGVPRWVRDDAERGFLYAYYQYLLDAQVAFNESDSRNFMLMGGSTTRLYVADFSTYYLSTKEKTIKARLLNRIDLASRWQHVYELPCTYHIWCFTPSTNTLTRVVDALSSDSSVNLEIVEPQTLDDRVWQTVWAIPDAYPDVNLPAFIRSAQIIRSAVNSKMHR